MKYKSDNQIRNLLDPLPASKIFIIFERVYQWLKKEGVIKKFIYLDGEILIALDGPEYFSSKKINWGASHFGRNTLYLMM